MELKGVDFPEPLIEAQQSGNLVVFAGAGVSMGPPSNLPSFRRLAEQVSGGTLVSEPDEPTDHFLGRLEKQGVQVHSRTRSIIANPKTRPTELLRSLLSLFPNGSAVRLVTTNFDRHFTVSGKRLFGNSVGFYYAPALPLGNDFEGIVYLHGSIERNEKQMVLTDRDFGRAYLTEGWATRFLESMFERYTVLFVGYSHNDVVMNYLARGLPPTDQRRRFALTDEEDPTRWEFLGIMPITYRLEHGRHEQLNRALAAWASLAKMGALDHERRIIEIVSVPPPLDHETNDYLITALTVFC